MYDKGHPVIKNNTFQLSRKCLRQITGLVGAPSPRSLPMPKTRTLLTTDCQLDLRRKALDCLCELTIQKCYTPGAQCDKCREQGISFACALGAG